MTHPDLGHSTTAHQHTAVAAKLGQLTAINTQTVVRPIHLTEEVQARIATSTATVVARTDLTEATQIRTVTSTAIAVVHTIATDHTATLIATSTQTHALHMTQVADIVIVTAMNIQIVAPHITLMAVRQTPTVTSTLTRVVATVPADIQTHTTTAGRSYLAYAFCVTINDVK